MTPPFMGPNADSRPLILASGSATRAGLLRSAGLEFGVEKPAVDEDEVKLALRGEGATAAMVAETLAELKASRVARRYPQAFVIGADQMLDCPEAAAEHGAAWFDKPVDRAAAARQLLALSGKTHQLISAVVIVLGDRRLWHNIATARLTMRPFGADFVERYLDAAGDAVLSSVGAYQVEGLGVQLFDRIQGDHATILGLPLLPLLHFLREHGIVSE